MKKLFQMTTISPCVTLLGACLLAACDTASADGADSGIDGGNPQAHEGQDEPHDDTSPAGPLFETMPELAADGSTTGAMVPARYQGVWDFEGGNCNKASDLRMEISPQEVLFYESVGTVTGVAQDGSDIIVTLDMEGEGETWVDKLRLSLEGDGTARRLHTSQGDKPKAVDEYPSMPCPA